MDLGRLLCQKFDGYVVARDAWAQNESNMELSIAARQEYLTSFEEARADLHQVMDDIRQQEHLVLASVSEARAFASLLPDFMANRGNLKGLQLHDRNMTSEDKTEIFRQLEDAGLRHEKTVLLVRFPAE